MLRGFYRCFIESILTFSFICWFGGLSVQNKNVLGRVVNVCGKVVGEKMKSLNELYECRVVKKARNIQNDATHILARNYDVLPSGRRLRVPRFSTVRGRKSFVPMSVSLLYHIQSSSAVLVVLNRGVC